MSTTQQTEPHQQTESDLAEPQSFWPLHLRDCHAAQGSAGDSSLLTVPCCCLSNAQVMVSVKFLSYCDGFCLTACDSSSISTSRRTHSTIIVSNQVVINKHIFFITLQLFGTMIDDLMIIWLIATNLLVFIDYLIKLFDQLLESWLMIWLIIWYQIFTKNLVIIW